MENPLLQFFHDALVLSNICQYLTISERLRLAATNKSIRYNMNELTKVLLKQNDLTLIPGKTPLRQLRFYFDRCLRIFKFDEQGRWQKLFTLQNPFKYQVITRFQVGNNYSAFLDNKSKAFVFKTNILKNGLVKQKDTFQTLSEVRSIHCKAQKLYYLKQDGSVWTCFSEKLQPKCLQSNVMINWTSQVAIQKMFVSYNYVIMFPRKADRYKILLQVIQKQHQGLQKQEVPLKMSKEKSEEHQGNMYKQDLFQGQSQGQYLILLNTLTNRLSLLKTPPEKIQNCVIGSKQAYFLTKSHRCYSIEFDNVYYKQYRLKQFAPFRGKSIVKIASGHNFFLALERDMQNIEDWSTERVAEWMREIGFQSFVRIAMVQKLDGKKLKNIQKKYMQNVLGMNKANMIQKFLMQIDELVNAKVYERDTLYGWGKNQCGQLASSSANFINQPQKIKLPSMKESQYIDSIFCGWEQTLLRTQKGRIHFSKRNVQKKKERQYQITMQAEKKPIHKKSKQIQILQKLQQKGNDSDSDDFQNVKFKYTKRKKRTQDFKDKDKKQVKGPKKFQAQQKWCESQFGKAFFVQGYKQFIFCIQCPQQHIEEPQRKVKLRTAKAILDKILWGRSNKQDFKIGYIDKQMGIIEYTTNEIQNFQFKENHIKYFKQKGLIVWDRQNKIDHF